MKTENEQSEPSENIGRTDEELVNEIDVIGKAKFDFGRNMFERMWKKHSKTAYNCDNMPFDYINTDCPAFYDMENEFATEIAKLLPYSRSQENGVKLPVFESEECNEWRYKNNWRFHADNMWHNEKTGERVTADTLYYSIFFNYEKQMKL